MGKAVCTGTSTPARPSDSNSDFFNSYENCEAQAKGEVVQPTLE